MPDRLRVSAFIQRGDSVALAVFHTTDKGEHFDLPGGGLEQGESLIDGVRRECREEIGCDVRVIRLLAVAEHLPSRSPGDYYEHQHVIDFIFECEIESGSNIAMPLLHDEDQVGVAWRPVEDLRRASLRPEAIAWLLDLVRGEGPGFFRNNIWVSE